MLSHCQARRAAQKAQSLSSFRPQGTRLARTAVNMQAQGFNQLSGLSTARRTVSLPSVARVASRSASNTPMSAVSRPLTPLTPQLATLPAMVSADSPLISFEKTPEEVEAEEHNRDLSTVRNELHRYKEDPLISPDKALDLVEYWHVSNVYFHFLNI